MTNFVKAAAPSVEAMGNAARHALPGVKLWGPAAGLAGAAGLDYLQNPDARYPFDPNGFHGNNRWRYGNAAINTMFLGAAPFLHRHPAAMYGALSSPFVKDVLVSAMPTMNAVRGAADTTSKTQMLGSLLGAGALGLGAAGLAKYISSKDREQGGRVRVKLPSKGPHSKDTEVDIPLGDVAVSPTQKAYLFRDVRKQLRSESQTRGMKLDAEHHKLIPFAEWKEHVGNMDEPKTASARLLNMVKLANSIKI